MFWKLSFRQPSAIDALLDKEDCTLNEVLDEDDVLQECKTHNKKLIDFLIRPEILEQLVRMICEEPPEDAEEKVKFKYPHLACELLTAEVYTIVEKLSSSESLLQLLWSFLDSSSPLDPLVGSFISKVLAMLLNKENINSVIMDFVKSHEDFIVQFLNHLGTSAMMDLLLQMVAAPENDKTRIELAEWLRDQGIVERLVDLVGNEADSEQCVNASVALCEMIRLSRESYQMSNPAPLHTKLESEETMKRLLANMFSSEQPSDVVIVNGISVLLTALERRPNNPAMSPAGPGGSYFNQPPEETHMESVIQPIGLESVLEVILPHLQDFHKLLSRTPEIGVMQTTVGVLDPPLGNTRLQVVRLMSAVLQCSSTSIAAEVIRLKTFTNLLDLFFAYPWNNFLHMTVEACIMAALFTIPPPPSLSSSSSSSLPASGGTPNTPTASQEGGVASQSNEEEQNTNENLNHKSLRHHLLIDCQLVSKLLGGAEKNEEASSKPQGCRQGYMGHLVRIANSVARCGDSDVQLREILKSSLDEQTHQRWNNFINGSLADMNKRNETNLGGNRPMLADDSDEEFDPVGGIPTDSELDKAYQQFLDVKYTSPILDDYGVEDELNPPEAPFEGSFTRLMDISLTVNADEEQTQGSTNFDAACSDRIQQFDDVESDDDDSSTWNDKEISFVSPVEQENRSPRSMSSGEDEEVRREIQTGSSDDEDASLASRRAALYTTNTVSQITSKKDTDPDRMEIDNSFGGMLSWRTDIATAEDLSGVSAMDTGGDWTKEPDSPNSGDQPSPRSNWADFNAAFGAKDIPQDMDLEPSSPGTHSHITVTYLSRASQESPSSEGDDDLMDSPKRRAGYNYSPLSPDKDQASPLNIDSIEVSVGGTDSSDEENNSSSDSDEERSGKYVLNTSTGSDGDSLLNSPGRGGQQENNETQHDLATHNSPSTSHDQTATPSSNGLETDIPSSGGGSSLGDPRKVLNSNENNCTNNTDSNVTSSSSGCNSEAGSGDRKVNSEEGRLPDGQMSGETELQDNFKFLSKGMLSSDGDSENEDNLINEQSRLIEQKRAEAQEVCEQFEKVQNQNS